MGSIRLTLFITFLLGVVQIPAQITNNGTEASEIVSPDVFSLGTKPSYYLDVPSSDTSLHKLRASSRGPLDNSAHETHANPRSFKDDFSTINGSSQSDFNNDGGSSQSDFNTDEVSSTQVYRISDNESPVYDTTTEHHRSTTIPTEPDEDIPISNLNHSRELENTKFHSHDGHSHHSHLIDKSMKHTNPEDTLMVLDESDPENLCSFCLCNPQKTDVYCKHEHLHESQTHHLTLHAHRIPKTARSLHILDFESVTIDNRTFGSQNLELRSIQFENIKHLELKKESLYFNTKASSNREVAVIFTKCSIKEIPTEAVTQYARSEDQDSDIDLENTRFITLHIERCNISEIRSYAFTQARLLFFKMSSTKVELMEEHSFHIDVYDEWVIEHSQLPMLAKHTICLRAQMIVVFSNNFIRGLQNRSLEITSSNQVLFEFNRVHHLGKEALMGIKPNGRGSNLVFLNNTVSDLQNQSLIISPEYPLHERKILDNKFNIICECDIRQKLQPIMGITAKSNQYENETFEAVVQHSLCRSFVSSFVYSNIQEHIDFECVPLPLPIIISATVVMIVIIITIIVCFVCNKRAEKAKEEANYLGECCYSHSFSTLNSGNPHIASPVAPSFSDCGSWERSSRLQQPWVIAVPEVKTYQQTEVNVCYEQTDPLNVSVRGSIQEPIVDFQRRAQVRSSCPFN